MEYNFYKFYHTGFGWEAGLLQKDELYFPVLTHLAHTYEQIHWEQMTLDKPIPFLLIGEREYGPYDENEDYIGYEAHKLKFPEGYLISQPGKLDFTPFIKWGSEHPDYPLYCTTPAPEEKNFVILINSEVKNILEQFNLPPHYFYPAKITHEVTREVRDYFLLHICSSPAFHQKKIYWKGMQGYFRYHNAQTNDFNYQYWGKDDFNDYWEIEQAFQQWEKKQQEIHQPNNTDISGSNGWEAFYFLYEEPYDIICKDSITLISHPLKEALKDYFENCRISEWQFDSEYLAFKYSLEYMAQPFITGYKPENILPQDILNYIEMHKQVFDIVFSE